MFWGGKDFGDVSRQIVIMIMYLYSKINTRVALVGSRPSSCQGGSHLLLGPFPEAFVFCQSVELHQH